MSVYETISTILIAWMGLQILNTCLVFIFGHSFVMFYDSETWEKPTGIIFTFLVYFSRIFFGIGPYLHFKFYNQGFIKRKLIILVSIPLMFIISVIIYYSTMSIVSLLFGK